ncbi:MAG TPA: heavy metal-associated domain-containing protein [Bacteroidia bacterium]|nr:heavy metal-associated domain-containing protein [Bacteroidia bacterium]
MTQIIPINGMACSACAASVEKRLAQLPGVKEVHVDLVKKEAAVTGDNELKAGQIQDALKGTNYTLA